MAHTEQPDGYSGVYSGALINRHEIPQATDTVSDVGRIWLAEAVNESTVIIWQALIAAIVTIVLAWINRQTREAIRNQAEVLGDISQAGHVITQAVNGHLREQLSLNAEMSRKLAELPNATTEDHEIADKAEKDLAAHDHNLSLINAKQNPPGAK